MAETVSELDAFFRKSVEDMEKKMRAVVSDGGILSVLKNGKRLRPVLSHLAFKVCTGGKETPYMYGRVLEGMIAMELAHTASLIHDDIIDGDTVRRGRTAFYIRRGVPDALLTGHRMIALGFDIALSHGDDIAKLYVDTWNEVLGGEFREIGFNRGDVKNGSSGLSTKSRIFGEYNRIIDMKTASLFSSACRAGALEAGASGVILGILADYGRAVGMAYQLADDLVDLMRGESIDSIVVPLLNKLGNRRTTNGLGAEEARRLVSKNRSRIKEVYLGEIRRHVSRAAGLARSEHVPVSQYTLLLAGAPAYIVNRMLGELGLKV